MRIPDGKNLKLLVGKTVYIWILVQFSERSPLNPQNLIYICIYIYIVDARQYHVDKESQHGDEFRRFRGPAGTIG